eukprot:SAG22_NODE_9303_length_597_cov_1.925703_1_plen_167_part_10
MITAFKREDRCLTALPLRVSHQATSPLYDPPIRMLWSFGLYSRQHSGDCSRPPEPPRQGRARRDTQKVSTAADRAQKDRQAEMARPNGALACVLCKTAWKGTALDRKTVETQGKGSGGPFPSSPAPQSGSRLGARGGGDNKGQRSGEAENAEGRAEGLRPGGLRGQG